MKFFEWQPSRYMRTADVTKFVGSFHDYMTAPKMTLQFFVDVLILCFRIGFILPSL